MTDQLDILLRQASGNLALILDFDGVLVEIAPTPDAIRVDPDLPPLLASLQRHLGGALAVVSGRPLSEIDHYLDAAADTVFGSHGAEFRFLGETGTPPAVLAEAARRLTRFAHSALGAIPGIRVEPKPAGVAVHYRQAPDERDRVAEMMAKAVAEAEGFELMAGKMVFEARIAGLHKGSAVDALMARAPFAGRMPLFIGDDVTDEDGMRAAIAHGGQGIKVGEGESVAGLRLPDPRAVHTFLRRLLPERAGQRSFSHSQDRLENTP